MHLEQLIDLKNLALKYFEPMPPPLSLNVRFQLKSIIDECVEEGWAKGKSKAVACPSACSKRGAYVAPDSSDEEADRLQLLGQQGK